MARTLTPETLDEAAEMVRSATYAGERLQPAGRRNDADASDLTILSTERLNDIVSHEPGDLIVVAQAGVTLRQLDDALSAVGQWLPIDPPLPDERTVGGMVASSAAGPLRFGYGTIRDAVLGMKMVLPDGRLVKSGAYVSKNTAGLDVHRLMIGSEGALGLIVEVGLRVRPKPATFEMVLVNPSDGAAAQQLDALMLGPLRPVMIELINSRAARQLGIQSPLGAVMLAVGFDGEAASVAWQRDRLWTEAGGRSLALCASESRDLHSALRDWPAGDFALAIDATIPSSRVAGFVADVAWIPAAVVAHAGNGVVRLRFAEAPHDDDVLTLIDMAASLGGSLRVSQTPFNPVLPRTAGRSHDRSLMHAIKLTYDPAGCFPPLPV